MRPSTLASVHGARLALAASEQRGTAEERRRLNAACQWLWVLDSAVQAAQRHDPVSAADVWLLHAIPVNARTPRRVPGGTETVTELSHGTTGCAERVRHAARIAAWDASWSPALTADSLSQDMARRADVRGDRRHGGGGLGACGAGGLGRLSDTTGQAYVPW